MSYRYRTADVFTDRRFGGNPLAVLTDARGLSGNQMQAIACEFNLSETTFVLPPDSPSHTRRVRIFTPDRELPFAGHPTIGTAFVLAATGEIPMNGDETRIVFEEGVGPVPVTIRSKDGRPAFTELEAAMAPTPGSPLPGSVDIAALLSLAPSDVLDTPPPQTMSCGVPFAFVGLNSLDACGRARLRMDVAERADAVSAFASVCVYTHETSGPAAHVRMRVFGPMMGVPEDPATGSAAAAIAGVLAQLEPVGTKHRTWSIEQGIEMGRPSEITVDADFEDGRVMSVRVGGHSVLVAEGTLQV